MKYLQHLAFVLLLPAALHAAPSGSPTAVIVEQVRYSELADELEALGTLRANETVDITATVADTISEIHFDDGERVSKGQILVQLTNAEEAALLSEARSAAEEAQRQAERLARLVKQGTAAESLLDTQRREAQTAQARLRAVQSRLDDRLLTAPFAGTVGLRRVSPGTLVSPGTVITRLVDDSVMKLDFTVPSIYLTTVRPGTPVEATTPAFPGRTFRGQVTSVDSNVDPVTRSLTARAVIPNDDGLLVPGLLMTLNLLRDQRDALVIAEEAVIPRADDAFVMVVNQNTEPAVVEERRVRLGARVPGQVEVLSGLTAGELIVTHGTLKLRPGAPIRIRAVDDGTRPLAELLRQDQAKSG